MLLVLVPINAYQQLFCKGCYDYFYAGVILCKLARWQMCLGKSKSRAFWSWALSKKTSAMNWFRWKSFPIKNKYKQPSLGKIQAFLRRSWKRRHTVYGNQRHGSTCEPWCSTPSDKSQKTSSSCGLKISSYYFLYCCSSSSSSSF